MKKVSVIGSGSWGTALAVMLDKYGHDVTVWSWQKMGNIRNSFPGCPSEKR